MDPRSDTDNPPARPKRMIGRRVVVIAVVVAALAAGVTGLAVATSANRACGGCHAMRSQVTSMGASSHAGLACYDCHLEFGAWSLPGEKMLELTRMVPAALAGRNVSGSDEGVSSEACTRCHQDIFTRSVRANGIAISHKDCASTARCDSCHGGVAHGAKMRWVRQPSMEECVGCHIKESAPVECGTCHASREKRERLAKGPWQVTHGAQWKTTHGVADLTYCVTCHPSDYCISCHGVELPHGDAFGMVHGAESRKPVANCETCHERATFCTPCHQGLAMPHESNFLGRHSRIASSMSDARCLRCHERGSCENCHLKHVHPGKPPKGFTPASGEPLRMRRVNGE